MTNAFTKTVGAASIALLALTGSALADGFGGSVKDAPAAEGRKFEWSVTGTATSDYIFRGLSLNDEDPAFQASIDASYGIAYIGLWGSMVDGLGFEPVELNLYGGIKPELGPVTFDFGAVYYFYPWANGPDVNIIELKAGAEFSPFANLTLKPVFWYIPDQSDAVETYTIEGSAAYEFKSIGVFTPTISALVGYTDPDAIDASYTYWNAGLSLGVDKFTFDFRYWDTDIDDANTFYTPGLADERFVFTASVTLP